MTRQQAEDRIEERNGAATHAWVLGDCWLPPGAKPSRLTELFGGVRPGLLALNLECSVPAGSARPAVRSLLPLDPQRLQELRLADNVVCVLANNHVTDFGNEGLRETIRAVRDAGLLAVGAGESLDQARAPALVEVAGTRVAIVAYADTAPHVGAIAATSSSAGVAPLDLPMITQDIASLRRRADQVWVVLHWGQEYIRYPEPEQRRWARELVRSGATAIFGIHPHVLRGYENIDGVPVYYSLGNLVFPPIRLRDGPLMRWHTESRKAVALRGTLGASRWTWSPELCFSTADGQPAVARGAQREDIAAQLDRLSRVLDDGYDSAYRSLCRSEQWHRVVRRLQTMSWSERARLPFRIVARLLEGRQRSFRSEGAR